MKIPPCPATSGSWQVLKVLGDGGSGEGPSFKKGLPPKMHFHEKRSFSGVALVEKGFTGIFCIARLHEE